MPQTVYFPTKDFHVERAVSKRPMSFMHHHESYEIYYTVSGEREYFIENSFFRASAGDFVLIPKNLLHRTAGKGADRILIYFSDDFLKTCFTDTMSAHLLRGFEPKLVRPDVKSRERVAELLYTLHNAYRADAEPERLAAYLLELLLLFSEEKSDSIGTQEHDSRLNQILCYINDNYHKIEHIDEIADHFYLSRSYLCRSFSRQMGVTLISYLNTVKIRAACDLLQKGDLSMTEIALRCGFNSSAYFCKVFKQETGFSPSDYKAFHLPNQK
ncbi:MAG: AraC family transcriptional regulator [Clostridia bacterium]|nr:AraC family transcriptional regulator [Clostridia bacterium]